MQAMTEIYSNSPTGLQLLMVLLAFALPAGLIALPLAFSHQRDMADRLQRIEAMLSVIAHQRFEEFYTARDTARDDDDFPPEGLAEMLQGESEKYEGWSGPVL